MVAGLGGGGVEVFFVEEFVGDCCIEEGKGDGVNLKDFGVCGGINRDGGEEDDVRELDKL